MDGSGTGAPTFSFPNDGITNAMKFSLGLSPVIRGYFGRLSTSTVLIEGQIYNSLTYSRPEPPPAGNVYSVPVSSNLSDWSTADTLETGNSVDGSLRTITIRDTVPLSPAEPKRFIKLEVVVPQ